MANSCRSVPCALVPLLGCFVVAAHQASGDPPAALAQSEGPMAAHSIKYHVGNWLFEPVYQPAGRVAMILAWRSEQLGDGDPGDPKDDKGGHVFDAVLYVRTVRDWPAGFGAVPANVQSSKGWVRAYWRKGKNYYDAVEDLAAMDGASGLRESMFWNYASHSKEPRGMPEVAAAPVEGDPIAEVAKHPANVPMFKDREPADRFPPAWNPSKTPCEDAAPCALTEQVMFDKLVSLFEVFSAGKSDTADPDPCMLMCPGQIALCPEPKPWKFVRRQVRGDAVAECVYAAPDLEMTYWDHHDLQRGGRTISRELRIPSSGADCMDAAKIPVAPFDTRPGAPGISAFCPVPPPSK